MRGRVKLRRNLVIWVAVLAALATACSGGGSGKAPSSTKVARKDWDKHAVTTIDGLVAKSHKALPKDCTNLSPLPFATYERSAKLIGSVMPLAVSECDALNETIEYSVFATAKDAQAFVAK